MIKPTSADQNLRWSMIWAYWVARLGRRAGGRATATTILAAASVLADRQYTAEQTTRKERAGLMTMATALSDMGQKMKRDEKQMRESIDRFCDEHPNAAELLGFRHSRDFRPDREEYAAWLRAEMDGWPPHCGDCCEAL